MFFLKKPKNLIFNNFKKIAFIPMNLIPNDKVILNHYIEKNPNTISSGVYFESGDLLLSKITPSFENGKQCIIKKCKEQFWNCHNRNYTYQRKKKNKQYSFLILLFVIR